MDPSCSEALFFRELGANGDGIVWIDGASLFLHRLDYASLIDHESSALRPIIFFFLYVVHFQDAGLLQHLAVHVAEERKRDADLLSKSVVGGGTVYANSEDDRIRCFELGHISLIGLKFFRSTLGKGKNVKGEDDVFLAAVITEVDLLPMIVEQCEIRSHVADLERGVIDFDIFLRTNRAGDHTAGQDCCNDQDSETRLTHAGLPLRAASIRPDAALHGGCLRANRRSYKFFRWAKRNGEPRFSRNSSQCSSGMDMKTSTSFGSNCVPEQRLISPLACERGKALRYGRSLIMASSESAMVKMREPRGMSSPFQPRG